MLLKAMTVDAAGDTIEQFSFTQLTIGNVTRDMVRPRLRGRQLARRARRSHRPRSLAGWGLSAELPGFQQDHGAEAPAGRVAAGRARWCIPTAWRRCRCSSSRSTRARRGAHRAGERRRDPHLYARSREPHGDRGRRSAGGERAAHRRRGRVPATAVRVLTGERTHEAHADPGGLLARLAVLDGPRPGRDLPDFTRLVEEQGGAVVNISTTQAVRRAAVPQVPGVEDEEMLEFFRRFIPRQQPGQPGRAARRRAARSARASSSAPTATSSPTRTWSRARTRSTSSSPTSAS